MVEEGLPPVSLLLYVHVVDHCNDVLIWGSLVEGSPFGCIFTSILGCSFIFASHICEDYTNVEWHKNEGYLSNGTDTTAYHKYNLNM